MLSVQTTLSLRDAIQLKDKESKGKGKGKASRFLRLSEEKSHDRTTITLTNIRS